MAAPRWLHGGRLVSALSDDGRRGYLLGLACETGFLAETEPFRELVRALVEHAIRSDADGLRDGERPFLIQRFGDATVKGAIAKASTEFREAVRLACFERIESSTGRVGAYVHHDHRVGALVALTAPASPDELDRFLRNLCHHVVAFTPVPTYGEAPLSVPTLEEVLDQPWVHAPSVSVGAALVRAFGPAAHIEGFRIARVRIT